MTLNFRCWGCVGAAWFRAVSEALGQEPGSSYRAWIAALCPDLLSGAFNHVARAEARPGPLASMLLGSRCVHEHHVSCNTCNVT